MLNVLFIFVLIDIQLYSYFGEPFFVVRNNTMHIIQTRILVSSSLRRSVRVRLAVTYSTIVSQDYKIHCSGF